MSRAAELASIVRAARRRLFFCEAHEVSRPTPETCPLCILEAICAPPRGLGTKFPSLRQIMSRPAGLTF